MSHAPTLPNGRISCRTIGTPSIASAARLLKKAGAGQVLAACTHGLFIEDAANRLRGCDDILSSDTIEGVYTRYSVAPAIAAAL